MVLVLPGIVGLKHGWNPAMQYVRSRHTNGGSVRRSTSRTEDGDEDGDRDGDGDGDGKQRARRKSVLVPLASTEENVLLQAGDPRDRPHVGAHVYVCN